MKLIYHLPNDTNLSPFDLEISKVIKNKNIKIACPYINYNYFMKIIDLAKNFKWITDINALLNSTNDYRITNILLRNQDKIRHCDGLHAKIIMSNDSAILGSANFTEAGIKTNNEISIIIEEKKELSELNNWFEIWWNKSILIVNHINIIKRYFKINKNGERLKKEIIIKSDKMINCYYDSGMKDKYFFEQKDEEYLINFLQHSNNKYFINYYFDLVKNIIDKCNISKDDPRLCITFRESNYRIPVTIGQRYVLSYDYNNKKENMYLIMNKGSENEDYKNEGLVEIEYYYKKNKKDVPFFHFKKSLDNFRLESKTILNWELAVEKELRRCKKSSYRKYHQDILYKFVADKNYRDYIISRL